MIRDIVVFEMINQEKDTASLDFRLVRQSLPAGACPLTIVTGPVDRVETGQYHTENEVRKFACQQSGYPFVGDRG